MVLHSSRLHCTALGAAAVPLQADIALLPFFERFRLALQLFQDYDLADVRDGALTEWMVSAETAASSLGQAACYC
jgi:hypothetical protein